MSRSFLPAVLLALTLVSAGCAEPPNKEMDQAQGAIDAARAAGAEQYATAEYTAAITALKGAHDAVAAGDYRLALNHALASHERAQNAARETANSKAVKRADAERTLAEIETALTQAQTRMKAGSRARVPQRVLAAQSKELGVIRADLQKARATVAGGDYLEADKTLQAIRKRIDAVLAALTKATPTPAGHRRR